MAVLEVAHGSVWEKHTDQSGHREYRKSFLVKVSSTAYGPDYAENAAGVPGYRTSYAIYDQWGVLVAFDPNAYCFDKTARLIEPLIWEVLCVFSTGEDQYENPLDRKPLPYWSFVKYEKTLDKDKDGNAVKNAAGDSFDPAPKRGAGKLYLRYVRNEAAFDPILAFNHIETVNSAQWFFAPARCAKCENISAEPQDAIVQSNRLYFSTVTYEFSFEVESFDFKILERGFRFLDAGVVRNIEVDGSPVQAPKLLTSSGGILPVGGTPVFKEVRGYPEKNFSVFNIPKITWP